MLISIIFFGLLYDRILKEIKKIDYSFYEKHIKPQFDGWTIPGMRVSYIIFFNKNIHSSLKTKQKYFRIAISVFIISSLIIMFVSEITKF